MNDVEIQISETTHRSIIFVGKLSTTHSSLPIPSLLLKRHVMPASIINYSSNSTRKVKCE